MDELSNWGRWGEDDQIGAANLMTEAKRLEAAALVETGETVSLSHDFLTAEAVDAAEPYVLQMRVNPEGQNSGDRVDVYFHGVTYSHLDGLCHVFYKDRLYNGHDYRDVVTDNGCSLMDTTQMKDGLVTRGILVDMPRLKGVPYLEPGTKLYREDIEAWEGARRRPAGLRRRPVAAHRPLGVPGRGGADAGDGGVGRLRDLVPGRARYRAPRGGLGARGGRTASRDCASIRSIASPSSRAA